MPATPISGPGLSKGGPEGRRGLKGDKPAHEVSDDGYLIRWEQPDGRWSPWFDVGSAAALEAEKAATDARRAEISRQQSESSRDGARDAEAAAESLVIAATAGFTGYPDGLILDEGYEGAYDQTTYFDLDEGFE